MLTRRSVLVGAAALALTHTIPSPRAASDADHADTKRLLDELVANLRAMPLPPQPRPGETADEAQTRRVLQIWWNVARMDPEQARYFLAAIDVPNPQLGVTGALGEVLAFHHEGAWRFFDGSLKPGHHLNRLNR